MSGGDWLKRKIHVDGGGYSYLSTLSIWSVVVSAFLGFVAGGIVSQFFPPDWTEAFMLGGLVLAGGLMIVFDLWRTVRNVKKQRALAQDHWEQREAETLRKIAEMQKKNSRIPKVERK